MTAVATSRQVERVPGHRTDLMRAVLVETRMNQRKHYRYPCMD